MDETGSHREAPDSISNKNPRLEREHPRWMAHYNDLKDFQFIHGHCNVTVTYNFRGLAHWVKDQRRYKSSGKLSAERLKLLEDIGFEWDRRHVKVRSSPSPMKVNQA